MDDLDSKKSNRIHVGALIIAILIVLVLFKVNLEKSLNSPQFKSNIEYIEKNTTLAWQKYIVKPSTNLWNNFLKLNLQKAKDGEFEINTEGLNQKIESRIDEKQLNNFFYGEETAKEIKKQVPN